MPKLKRAPSKPVPTTTDEGLELAKAVHSWKEQTGVPFPSWTQVVEILKKMGRWKERE